MLRPSALNALPSDTARSGLRGRFTAYPPKSQGSWFLLWRLPEAQVIDPRRPSPCTVANSHHRGCPRLSASQS